MAIISNKKHNILVVVDVQNDFIDGVLGTKEAEAIVDNVVKRINEFSGKIYVTMDTHMSDYLDTNEGKKLPVPHCIRLTHGWLLNEKVRSALEKKEHVKIVEKQTFGSVDLANYLVDEEDVDGIELIGLCTDICVVSNALLIKASLPETDISVNANCCAGVTPELHKAALDTMKSCQINIIGG